MGELYHLDQFNGIKQLLTTCEELIVKQHCFQLSTEVGDCFGADAKTIRI